jgi:hypothetical protein
MGHDDFRNALSEELPMMIFLGYNVGGKEIFQSDTIPTWKSHGGQYAAVVGPFKTVRGAKAMLHYGDGNPHMLTVADAERIGKQYKNDLAKL